MKLSTRSRYGVRLMMQLGVNYGGPAVRLQDIAREEGLSAKYLSRIIIPLREKGLVRSVRGARGGYYLAKAPSEISLKEILVALEGGLSLVECVDEGSSCERQERCAVRGIWEHVQERFADTLASIKLEELVVKQSQKRGDHVGLFQENDGTLH